MSNLIKTKVPYSAKAVDNLLHLEQSHFGIGPILGFGASQSSFCSVCFGTQVYTAKEIISCRTLIEARKCASRETLIAVALILKGEGTNE